VVAGGKGVKAMTMISDDVMKAYGGVNEVRLGASGGMANNGINVWRHMA